VGLLSNVTETDRIPSRKFLRLVDHHAERITDPVERLKFVRAAREAYRPRWPHWCYLAWGTPPSVRLLGFRCSGSAVTAGSGFRRVSGPVRWTLVAVIGITLALTLAAITSPHAAHRGTLRAGSAPPRAAASAAAIWMVESFRGSEVYSNGLRIETQYATSTARRAWRGHRRLTLAPSEWRSDPAGIVFHTTESNIAPFEAAENTALRRNAMGVLEWVKHIQCYHFVIDRFGRVFRVVAETDYANHAGPSVWADADWVYVGLNQSFLSVAFEAAQGTGIASGESGAADAGRRQAAYTANPAQVHSARILTDLLRGRYHIDAANCVTHAQVSINSQNMTIGYHTDWAGDFPFQALGLGDGYGRTLASISVFGFTYDGSFLHAIGRQVWPGMLAADEQILREAAGCGMTPADYRLRLQRNYRNVAAAFKAERETGAETVRQGAAGSGAASPGASN
jgi:hypothetical protein